MNLRREDLIEHLKRITCSGKVKQAIFSGAFSAQALTPDHLLLVKAPGLDGVEDEDALEAPIGVADMDLFIKSLSMIPGSEDDVGCDVSVENHRLVINEPGRGSVRLLTAQPRTIETRVEDAVVESLLGDIGDIVVPLSFGLLSGVQRAFEGLKATDVEMVLGPSGGSIRVGDEASHMAQFPLAELTSGTPLKLNFGEHFISVLKTVNPDAVMYIPIESNKPIIVQDGDYYYMLSPRSFGADKKKTVKEPAKKGGKAKAAELATA
jgi:hypothetical protein